MPRVPLLVAVLALALLAGVAVAQEATPAPLAEHPLVGAWRIVPDPPGPPLVLIVYHADGTLTFSAPSGSPAPEGAPFAVAFDTRSRSSRTARKWSRVSAWVMVSSSRPS